MLLYNSLLRCTRTLCQSIVILQLNIPICPDNRILRVLGKVVLFVKRFHSASIGSNWLVCLLAKWEGGVFDIRCFQ